MTAQERKRTMRFGTWNVRALRGKELELIDEIKKYNLDILGITETNRKGQGVEEFTSHKLIFSGVDTKERARAGVALLVRNEIFDQLDYHFINERLLAADLNLKGLNLKLIVAYGPNEDAAKEEKDNFFNNLQTVVESNSSSQEILILGDLNARVGNNKQDSYGAIGKEGEDMQSPNGEILIDFCIRNNLKIANTFFKHKSIHKWTRVSEERNERSIIDYVIVSNHLFYKTQDVKVRRGAEIYSDHFLLEARFSMQNFRTKQKTNKQSKIRIEELKNSDKRSQYQKLIKSKLDKAAEAAQDTNDLENLWKIYKEVLTKSAKEICGLKTIGGTKKRTAWWNENVKEKIKEKKRAWKKYLASKKMEDLEYYKIKRREAKDSVKQSKQEQWEIFGERLESNYKENQKMFWGTVKRYRKGYQCPIKRIQNKEGKVAKDTEEILEVWKDYFKNLHNPDTQTNINEDANTHNNLENEDLDEEEITIQELLRAKKKIKIGKAAGIDEIFPEMIVSQGSEADELLLKICNLANKIKCVPREWKTSIIIPIHKNGSTMQCENYRGISLISVPGKVYARILENRLRSKVEDSLSEQQSGFRPNRSVQDHIYSIRQICESTYRYDKEFHACFVDLQKAFDSVQRKELWKALEEHGVNKKLIESIKSFYSNSESAVRISGKISEKIFN